MQQSALEALFLEHLPIIHRVAAAVAGRNGLRGDEVPELASWIVSRLVEDDYAALRKFRGESSLATYLTVVVTMLARDYRIQRWGRWRPSAAARRSGDIAVRLETLVYGRGYTLRQAGELMRTTGATQLTDRELAGLIAQLPSREPLRPVEVGIGTLAALAAPDGADSIVESEIYDKTRQKTVVALDTTLQELSVEDRIILRMRFWDNMSVAEIARGMNLEQKPLYRRFERLLGLLRTRLLAAGVTREQITDLFAQEAHS